MRGIDGKYAEIRRKQIEYICGKMAEGFLQEFDLRIDVLRVRNPS